MKKILHIVPTLGYGGVAKVICNYYECIDHSKYSFDIITHGKVEDYHQALVNDGCKIFYFKTLGEIGGTQYRNQIKKNLILSDYDIVHIHTGVITGLYAIQFRMCGAKIIVNHGHTTRGVSMLHSLLAFPLRLLAKKTSDACIGCGEQAGIFCFGKNNFSILPNSIDFNNFNNISSEQVAEVKKELSIPDNAIVIGHVGVFTHQKNHDFLLDVFYHLIQSGVDSYLVLCGDGPLQIKMKEKARILKIEHRVIFTGIRNDINILMKIFNIFIFPSHYEGLPVVAIEAQTAGLRCLLSSNIDSKVDIGCNAVQMLPINKGPEIWVNALKNEITHPQRSDSKEVQMALKQSGYNITETVKKLTNIYDKLIESYKS